MSIRLNKALRELNIGLQTAVEFLEKKSELGEVKAEPSFKLNERQYDALVEAFKQDAAVRNEAEKLFKKSKEKKRVSEPKKDDRRAESLLESNTRQQYKILGKIDLDSVGQKPAVKESVAPRSEEIPEVEAAAVSQEPEAKEVVETVQPALSETPAEKEDAPVVEQEEKVVADVVTEPEKPATQAPEHEEDHANEPARQDEPEAEAKESVTENAVDDAPTQDADNASEQSGGGQETKLFQLKSRKRYSTRPR
jgi:translation initiation factor IF-2